MTITVTWRNVVQLLGILLCLYLAKQYIDNRIITYISTYDQYKSQQQNDAAITPGDGEPAPLGQDKSSI